MVACLTCIVSEEVSMAAVPPVIVSTEEVDSVRFPPPETLETGTDESDLTVPSVAAKRKASLPPAAASVKSSMSPLVILNAFMACIG